MNRFAINGNSKVRIGETKISGTVSGSIKAGIGILSMIAKLFFVLALVIYHLKTHFILKELQQGIVNYSSDFMRIWNEVTSIILVSIVFLVVLKNNVNWLKFTIGTILFVLVILILIKLYKRIRN